MKHSAIRLTILSLIIFGSANAFAIGTKKTYSCEDGKVEIRLDLQNISMSEVKESGNGSKRVVEARSYIDFISLKITKYNLAWQREDVFYRIDSGSLSAGMGDKVNIEQAIVDTDESGYNQEPTVLLSCEVI